MAEESGSYGYETEQAREERELIEWAEKNGLLVNNPVEHFTESVGQNPIQRTESTVWLDTNKKVAVKAISSHHYDSFREVMEKIVAHNMMFPDTAMKVVGIGSQNGRASIIAE